MRLGLDILTIAEHPELAARLQRLVVDERVSVRTDALERLVQRGPADGGDRRAPRPRRSVIGGEGREHPGARCDAGIRRTSRAIAAHSSDAASEVKVAVAFALTRVGDDAVRAAGRHRDLRTRSIRDARAIAPLAALMLGEVEPGDRIDRTTLRTLLADPDPRRRQRGARRAPLAGGRRAARRGRPATSTTGETAGAAVDALVRVGDAALVVVDEGLRGDEHASSRSGAARARRSRDRGTVGRRGAPSAHRASRP